MLELLVEIFKFHLESLDVRLSGRFSKDIGLKCLHALDDIRDLDLAFALQVTQIKLLLLLFN